MKKIFLLAAAVAALSMFPSCRKGDTVTGTAKAKLTGTGEVDVKWVQLWKDGPRWATINLGVTSASSTKE